MPDDPLLPSALRLLNETAELEFEGLTLRLTLSFYGERIGEAHVTGLKSGSAIEALTQDACTLISELLQRFVSPDYLMERMQRTNDGSPASVIGAIIFHLKEYDIER